MDIKQQQQQQQQQQQKQQKQDEGKKDFTIVSIDESFFFYDSLVRRVWIDENKRPIIRVTGSHQLSCIFGALGIEEKKNQLLRQYDICNGDIFLDYLKKIHIKFPKCYLFMTRHHNTTNQRSNPIF